MRCPSCSKEGTFRPWEGPQESMGLTILARGSRCSACGEIVFSHAEMQAMERSAASAIVERGIRSGHDFKVVRKAAGFRAVEVAEMLAVRPETVSRWERNEVDLPRTAAFALGELFLHPIVTRKKLEAFSA